MTTYKRFIDMNGQQLLVETTVLNGTDLYILVENTFFNIFIIANKDNIFYSVPKENQEKLHQALESLNTVELVEDYKDYLNTNHSSLIKCTNYSHKLSPAELNFLSTHYDIIDCYDKVLDKVDITMNLLSHTHLL